MTRGIHLKHLTTTDLEALGLRGQHGVLDGRADAPPLTSETLLAEVDPVLCSLLGEVREGLEGTLRLLDQALATKLRGNDL